jgi:hypothetical protein
MMALHLKYARLLLAFVTVLFLPCRSMAQRAIPDDNLGYPVRIDLRDCAFNVTSAQGTGFLMRKDDRYYVVTARHVLFNVSAQIKPGEAYPLLCKKATLLSNARKPKELQQNIVEMDLEQLNAAGKIKGHPTHDVAVISYGTAIKLPRASEADPQTFGVQLFPGVIQIASAPSGSVAVSMDTVRKFDDVLSANDIYIMGYPSSIGIQQAPQLDYNRPLLRKGIIAGENPSNKTLVLDCPSFFGNSGGPVLEVEHEGLGTHYSVVGVVSQYVPFAEVWQNATMSYSYSQIHNSGYSIAESMDYVLELLD